MKFHPSSLPVTSTQTRRAAEQAKKSMKDEEANIKFVIPKQSQHSYKFSFDSKAIPYSTSKNDNYEEREKPRL